MAEGWVTKRSNRRLTWNTQKHSKQNWTNLGFEDWSFESDDWETEKNSDRPKPSAPARQSSVTKMKTKPKMACESPKETGAGKAPDVGGLPDKRQDVKITQCEGRGDLMEDSSFEVLKKCYQNLQKTLECPICIDVVKQPFKQCARGHLMCVGCLDTLTSCVTCQGQLLLDNPVCIKSLLEYLPQDCRYSTNGCKKIIGDTDNHEKFCGFRHIKCRASGCVKKILAKGLLEHCKTHHDNFVIKDNGNYVIRWENVDPVKKRVSKNLVYFFNNLFWVTMENNVKEKQLKLWFEVIPVEKLENDYYIKVTFINGDFDFRSTVKAYIPEENEPSSQGENVGTDKMDQFCMKIPQMMLPHLVNEDGHLVVSSLIFFKG